jgi:hypothetical protein
MESPMSPIDDPRDLDPAHRSPAEPRDRLCVRRDVSDRREVEGALAPCMRVAARPARRCRPTAETLLPGRAAEPDPRARGQDFGAPESVGPAEFPDPLARDGDAPSCPAPAAGGADPALTDIAEAAGGDGRVAVVAPAGRVCAGRVPAPGCTPGFDMAALSRDRPRRAGAARSAGLVNGVV